MADITIESLNYYHGKGTPYEIKALDDINLSIKEGRITGIIGHTGSGKSTLVQMLNGILKPYSGRVLLSGEDIWKKHKSIREVRFKVGLVMQYPEYQLFEETVYKDIAYGPKNMGLKDDEIDACVREAAGFADLSEELFDKSPFDLSGGQKRRVAIAGIIAMRPDVLVLDEPAAGLDPRGRAAIFGNIVDYQRKSGKTVVIVSHSMEDMAKLNREPIGAIKAHYGIDSDKKVGQMLCNGCNSTSDRLPIIAICDTFGRVVYFSQGYNTSLSEQLKYVIHKL